MSARRKKNKDPNEVEFNGEVAKLQKSRRKTKHGIQEKKEKPLMKYRRQMNKGCLERKRDVCKLFRKLCKLIIPVWKARSTGLH